MVTPKPLTSHYCAHINKDVAKLIELLLESCPRVVIYPFSGNSLNQPTKIQAPYRYDLYRVSIWWLLALTMGAVYYDQDSCTFSGEAMHVLGIASVELFVLPRVNVQF